MEYAQLPFWLYIHPSIFSFSFNTGSVSKYNLKSLLHFLNNKTFNLNKGKIISNHLHDFSFIFFAYLPLSTMVSDTAK
jgi:hypothetical protein